MKSDFSDSVWCKFETLLIGVYYRFDNSLIVGSENNDKLCELIKELCGENVLVMGDFNFPEIDWTSNTVNASDNTECAKFFRVRGGWFSFATHNIFPRGIILFWSWF